MSDAGLKGASAGATPTRICFCERPTTAPATTRRKRAALARFFKTETPQLDGPATTALLQSEAVQAIADNPRLVQSATMTATRANAGRREMLSLQSSPGTLTS